MKELKVPFAEIRKRTVPGNRGLYLTCCAKEAGFDTDRFIALYDEGDYWLLRQTEE